MIRKCYDGNVSQSVAIYNVGDWVGWLQHGDPQWGQLSSLTPELRVQTPQGMRRLRSTDIAVWQPDGPEADWAQVEAAAGRLHIAELWRGLLACFGDRQFSVAEAIEGLAMRPQQSGALWLAMWRAPEYIARTGRGSFRARSAAEHATEALRLAERRQEEAMLAKLEHDWAAFERGGRTLADLVLSQPEVEAVARGICQGTPSERPSERARVRIEKVLLAAHAAEGAAWPLGYALAAALSEGDPWQNGDPRLVAQQRWLRQGAGRQIPFTGQQLQPRTELWAIDDYNTADRDDAIGVCRDGDRFILQVAIADLTAGVAITAPNLNQAARLATTVYLPTGNIPMLPAEIGAASHSLSANDSRPVLLLTLELAASDGAWLAEPKLQRGLLRLSGVAAYDDIDAGSVTPAGWADAVNVASLLQLSRQAAGAEDIKLADITIDVRDGHPIAFRRFEPWRGARLVVREAMIAANYAFAHLLKQARLPAPFRSIQARVDSMIAKVDTRPVAHMGLGLPYYVYATSPIRRFADILAQIQLTALLGQGTAIDEPTMRNWIERFEPAFHASKRWMEQALRYWKLRYLESYPQTQLVAQPEPRASDLAGTTRVRLLPLDIVLYVDQELQPSRGVVPVKLSNVDAEKNILQIELDIKNLIR